MTTYTTSPATQYRPTGTPSLLSDADIFMFPLDPARAVRRIGSRLEELSEQDPRLGEARRLLEEHLDGLERADLDEIVAPLLWHHGVGGCFAPPWFYAISRHLADGERAMTAVQAALATVLNPRVLQQVIQEARESEAAHDAAGTVLSAARREWQAIVDGSAENVAPLVVAGYLAIAFVAGVAVGVAVDEVLHHH